MLLLLSHLEHAKHHAYFMQFEVRWYRFLFQCCTISEMVKLQEIHIHAILFHLIAVSCDKHL